MKTLINFLLAVALLGSSTVGYASDEIKAVEAFASAYAQEQIKAQLANYLNHNPQIIGSVNPNIGDQSMRYVGKIIAVYGFMHARNDKDRAFALAQFLVPDPTTAMILFAIQLGDAVLTMQHQRDLAKIYEDVAVISRDTVKIWTHIYKSDYSQQIYLINKFSEGVDRIEKFKSALNILDLNHPNSIAEAMSSLFSIEDEVEHLNQLYAHIELKVNFVALGFSIDTASEWKSVMASYNSSLEQLKLTRQKFLAIFHSMQRELIANEIQYEVAENRDVGDLYVACMSAINSSDAEPDFIESCKVRFGLKGDLL